MAVRLLVGAAASAHAEPTAAEKETARTLMAQGRARRAAGDAEGALTSFRAADALMGVPTTGLEVARSEVALLRLVEARDTLKRVLRLPASPAEPRPFQEARAAAQALDAEVARRIPTVTARLEGAAPGGDVELEVDGARLPAAVAAAPLRLNPGSHTLTARAPKASGSVRFQLAEGETRQVAVILVPLLPVRPAPAAESAAEPSRPLRTAAFVSFGGAGVALATGAVSGVLSAVATNHARPLCPDNACSLEAEPHLAYARATATVSTAGFLAAGGLAVLGVGLFVADTRSHAGGQGRGTLEPWVGAGSAGLRGRF